MTIPAVDIGKYRDAGVRLLSGRDRGEMVRETAKLEQVDDALRQSDADSVQVHVPDDIVLMSSSFLLGMFGDSIREFGEIGFRKRFRFEGPYSEHYLSRAINEALKRGSPFRQTKESA